jgi:hypothetical protein
LDGKEEEEECCAANKSCNSKYGIENRNCEDSEEVAGIHNGEGRLVKLNEN